MAITYVKECGTGSVLVASGVGLALSGSPSAGNLLIIIFSTVSTATVNTVTDSQSNSWNVAKSSSTNAGIYVYYSILTTGLTAGSDTITITFTGATTPNSRAYLVEEFSGIAASPLDSAASATATTTTTALSITAAANTAQSSELMVFAAGVNSTGQTYTPDGADSLFTTSSIGATREIMASYRILAAVSTPSVSATKTGTQGADMTLSFYKATSTALPPGIVVVDSAVAQSYYN